MIRLPNLQTLLDAIDKRKKAAFILDWLQENGYPVFPGCLLHPDWIALAEATYKNQRRNEGE